MHCATLYLTSQIFSNHNSMQTALPTAAVALFPNIAIYGSKHNFACGAQFDKLSVSRLVGIKTRHRLR